MDTQTETLEFVHELTRKRKYEEALAFCRERLEKSEDHSETAFLYRAISQIYSKMDVVDEVQKNLQKSREIDPHNLATLLDFVFLYIRLSDYDSAIEVGSALIKLDKHDRFREYVLAHQAYCHYKIGNHREFLDVLSTIADVQDDIMLMTVPPIWFGQLRKLGKELNS